MKWGTYVMNMIITVIEKIDKKYNKGIYLSMLFAAIGIVSFIIAVLSFLCWHK